MDERGLTIYDRGFNVSDPENLKSNQSKLQAWNMCNKYVLAEIFVNHLVAVTQIWAFIVQFLTLVTFFSCICSKNRNSEETIFPLKILSVARIKAGLLL